MRRLTLALLCATYLCLSLIVALTLWRNGGGWGAGVAALVGGLGLCFAFHGLIERALETGAIKGEIAAVREAHSILIDQVVKLDARLSSVIEPSTRTRRRGTDRRGPHAGDLVQRMQHRLDEQGRRRALPVAAAPTSPVAALLETVARRCREPRRSFTCSRSWACRSAARSSTRATRGCATRPAA